MVRSRGKSENDHDSSSSNSGRSNTPFPGLRAYTEDELDNYSGRERQRFPFLRELTERCFISLQGGNAVGKTSFMNCVVLPELRSGFMVKGKKEWHILTMRPGEDPIATLAAGLAHRDIIGGDTMAQVDANLTDKFDQILRKQRYGLVDIVANHNLISGHNILIFIDQLDELLNLSEPKSASLFIDRIVEIANQSAYPIHVITASRIEQVGEFVQFPAFAELMNRNNFLLPPIDRQDVMELLEKVSQKNSLVFRPALIELIHRHYASNPLDLPRFQHAMRLCVKEVMSNRGVKTIGVIHLKTVGGLSGSISSQAEAIYSQLLPQDKKIARSVFQALTGKTNQGVRYARYCKLALISELTSYSLEQLIPVVSIFAQPETEILEVSNSLTIEGRMELLPLINTENKVRYSQSSIVSMSRELIINDWQRLTEWVDLEAINAATFIEIAEAARKKDHLYQGEKLKSTWAWFDKTKPEKGWASRYHGDYKAAVDFLMKSKDGADREAEIRKAEEISREQKSIRNKRIIAGVLFVALLLLVFSMFEKRDADFESRKAQMAEEKAREASLKATRDSTNAAMAVRRAMQAVYKADTSEQNAQLAMSLAEEAEEKARSLRLESDRLSSEVRNKESALEQTVAQMNKSRLLEEYLSILSRIVDLADESGKILSRAEDPAQLLDGAEMANEAFVLFGLTQGTKFNAIEDSTGLVTEDVKKKLFSSMNLAIQKVKKSKLLSEIKGGADIARIVTVEKLTSGVFLVGTNNKASDILRIRVVNGEPVGVNKVVEAASSELKFQGVKAMAVSNSKLHFMVSHAATQQTYRSVSLYTMEGKILSTLQIDQLPVAAFPFGASDFLMVDQMASIYLLKQQQDQGFLSNRLSSARDELTGVDFDPTTMRAVIATLNRKVEIFELDTENQLKRVNGFSLSEFNSEITALKIISKYNWLAVGNRLGQLYLYDLETGKVVFSAFNEHVNNINVLQLSPNGDLLVSGGRDKTVNVWNLDEIKTLSNSLKNKEKYQPVQFVEEESIRDVEFVNDDWIMIVSSSEGFNSYQSGRVSLLPLDFEITGNELSKLVK